MSKSTNLLLELNTEASGSAITFLAWRMSQNGDTSTSNAYLIDKWAGTTTASLVSLQSQISSVGVTNGNSHDHVGGDGAAITENALSLSDVTTGSASISRHGFLPKLPNSSASFVDGTGAWDTIKDTDLVLSTSDTTKNASTTSHGFKSKLTGDATKFQNENGAIVGIPSQIYLSAAGMSPAATNGCSDLSVYSTANGQDFRTLDFTADGQYAQSVSFRLPSDFSGTTFTASVDWTASSGTVAWAIDAICYGDTEALNQSWGGTSGSTSSDTATGAYYFQNAGNTGNITPVGTPSAGELCLIRIRKASGTANPAKLIGIQINYTRG